MTAKKKLLLSLFRPDQQHGQIHHIRPCGTGPQQSAAMVKYRITIVFFQGMTCLLHPRHSQIPGPGASSGSVRRAIGAVRTGKQGADMRAVLQGQAGCQRHFLIAPSPAPAAERHRRLTTGQQAERLCIRRQFGRHPPGLRHQQGRLLPGFPHHFVRQDDRTEALLPGLLRRRIQGLPVGGDQGILHMPEQGIPRLGRLGILTQTAFLKMIQDSRRQAGASS